MRLILLPGLDGTGNLFQPVLSCLPQTVKDHTDILSYPCNNKFSHADLLSHIRQNLPRNEKYIIAGESFSAALAYMLATEKPPLLKAVIFIAGFLAPPLPWLPLLRILPLSQILKFPIPQFIADKFLLGPGTDQEVQKLFRSTINKVPTTTLAHRLRQITDLNLNHTVVDLPCTYLQALDDKLVPAVNIQAFKSRFPQMDIRTVPGTHFILQSKPRECAAILVELYQAAIKPTRRSPAS